MSIYGAYLEDYHFIKLIIPKDVSFTKLMLSDNAEDVILSIFKEEVYGNERHLYTSFEGYINLHKDYFIIVSNKHQKCLKYQLFLGKITRTKRFDIENYTSAYLGVDYHKDYSTFSVWSPVAKDIILVLNEKEFKMTFQERGLWKTQIMGDLEKYRYYYLVRVNDKFIKTLDPYAVSNAPNFEYSYVVDLNNTYKQKNDHLSFDDPIIEEISIRDLTSFYQGGTFKDGTLSANSSYGLGYLKTLGVNYLQVMPVFSFGGVDEVKKDDYNWGYNPVSYNAVSNYLTKDFDNPYGAINELKEFIDTVHSLKMGITMDVVFNHVYDAKTFPFGVLVPGYAYHTDCDGFMTSSSGCGNDLNTTKSMVRRFILDSLKYYQNYFKFDGFRFDLMDLIDVETLNRAYKELSLSHPDVLVYGEGWSIPMVMPKDQGGLAENFWELPNYAFFNDYFRNAMKSNFDCSEGGFCLGKKYNHQFLYSAFTGFCVKEERWSSPRFSINYIECHDNYTFYDTLLKIKPDIKEDEIIDRTILALGCVILSQGIPFLHLGLEFGRNKLGEHNSYNLSDEVNMVRWENVTKYMEVVDVLKTFILLRKNYSFFRLKNKDEIKKRVFLDHSLNSLTLRYLSDDNNIYVLIVKNDYEEEVKYFAPGTKIIFDGRSMQDVEIEHITFKKPGIYLFKK